MRWNDAASFMDTDIWVDADVYFTTAPATITTFKTSTTRQEVNDAMIAKLIKAGTFTADSTLNGIIPAGVYLDKIIALETNGHTGQISGGTAAAGAQLFGSVAIGGSDSTVINVAKYFTAVTPIYLHASGSGDSWNSMAINIILIYFKI